MKWHQPCHLNNRKVAKQISFVQWQVPFGRAATARSVSDADSFARLDVLSDVSESDAQSPMTSEGWLGGSAMAMLPKTTTSTGPGGRPRQPRYQ